MAIIITALALVLYIGGLFFIDWLDEKLETFAFQLARLMLWGAYSALIFLISYFLRLFSSEYPLLDISCAAAFALILPPIAYYFWHHHINR